MDGWRAKHKRKRQPASSPAAPVRAHTFANRVRPKFTLKETSTMVPVTKGNEQDTGNGAVLKDTLPADSTALASIGQRAASLPTAKQHDIDVITDKTSESSTDNEKRVSSPSVDDEDDETRTGDMCFAVDYEDMDDAEYAGVQSLCKCMNTFMVDGREERCDGITNGAQLIESSH